MTNTFLKNALEEHFGFREFRDQQELIIQSIIDRKDTFVIMPTGGGKSLCYQLPAMMMEGLAVIVSPLIALMKNQVDSIRSFNQNSDIANFLNSSLNKTQISHVKRCIQEGVTKMLFVAPETLVKEENLEFLKGSKISFVAIDEAHCISEWGHDFRPEYRNLREMIDMIDKTIPMVALTATATPKVQSDIVKNLRMNQVNIFKSSFDRQNLYYEIRAKKNKDHAIKSIVQVIKSIPGQAGIIYVQSRKSTEEIAKILQVNGVRASPYHAGLDTKVRNSIQDDFLMENIEVIVATIAFGMGIDKPDVRFVIHYDIPKSIENYYQETGRAGRDGINAKCIAYYSHKDIVKLEKFLKDKPLAERELSVQLMDDVIALAETANCRRDYLLNYFGEDYRGVSCGNMCDNCAHPKPRIEASEDMILILQALSVTSELYVIKFWVDFIMGTKTKELKEFMFDKKEHFGLGNHHDPLFWHSIIRHAIHIGYIDKIIEKYGLIQITEKGKQFCNNPASVMLAINHDYETSDEVNDAEFSVGNALDETLLSMLKDLRKSEARKRKLQPWIVFLDPSLVDMATFYPTSIDEICNMTGVSKGKALKFGTPFISLIQNYVEDNNIDVEAEFVMKQVAQKSTQKIAIIQAIDKKVPLDNLAKDLKISFEDLLLELNQIVNSGTKIKLDYFLEDYMDEDTTDTIVEYFDEAIDDNPETAYTALKDDDIAYEEILLIRIKFMSENAL